MAGLLVLGAIPSGLAGTAHTAQGLYLVRFFIGILGGTFVSCQAWTTVFFDKNVVGTGNSSLLYTDLLTIHEFIANALAAGWGNSGGGVTFVVMIALYNGLVSSGLASSVAWRAAFVVVPVPFLLLVAIGVMVFGTDHPAGKWSDRHKAVDHGQRHTSDQDEEAHADDSKDDLKKQDGPAGVEVTVVQVDPSSLSLRHDE